MSTATYERPPLYAVPTTSEPKDKFGLLLALRRRARQALDTLLALPRGAGWVLRHLRGLLDEVGEHRLLAQATTLIRSGATLIRGVGAIPIIGAVLSTPPVWRTAVRWARAAGSGLTSLARRAWARTKSLLTRSSTTGARIATAMSRAGATAVHVVRSVAAHPAVEQVMHAAVSLAGAIRPLSQAVVAHRALALLVPVAWIRVAVEAVALTFLLAPNAAQAGRSTSTRGAASTVAHDDQHPTTASTTATTVGIVEEGGADELVVEPHNRAERRAQQQEQARARRSHTRR